MPTPRSKCPWGAHWRGNPFPAPAGAASPPSARWPFKASLCEGGGAKRRRERYAAAAPWHQAKGTFRAPARGTFAPGGKSTQKRRSNLRFENPLRAFTQHLSRWCSPRERCAVEISPKCCIVSASLSAAAFAPKCRVVRFYIWCVGAGFYAVERSGTSALGVPRPPFLHYVSGGAEPRPYEPFRQQQFFQTSGQRPPPTFAALRQRRDLIIAPPGGCFQRGRARTDRKPSERKIV